MKTETTNELLTTPVGKIVADHPAWSRVFERHHLDYCCKGKTTLSKACAEANLDPNEVVIELLTLSKPVDETDWTATSLSDLIEHIVKVHHAYLRTELPRISALLTKVVRAHGERHPEVMAAENVFRRMSAELASHMIKEECVLFPAIQELEMGTACQFGFGSVANPISAMEHEHSDAGDALERLRELTDGYNPPKDTCPTHRALYEALQSLERDLHEHIHKENNILFPRAQELESRKCGGQSFIHSLD